MTMDEARRVLERTTPFLRIGSRVLVRDVRLLTAVADARGAVSVVLSGTPSAHYDDAARRRVA